jgi:hypothetical protein
MVVYTFAMIGVAVWLFNWKPIGRFGHKTLEEQIREWEQKDLLESTTFQATRAFGVEEFEDEGSSDFLELSDGRVLFLMGQYLYEYGPDDGEKRTRKFPCSEFSIRRHKRERYVVDLQCRGTVLEPEVVAQPFNEDDWKHARVPEDGEVITARTYDALKRELLSR